MAAAAVTAALHENRDRILLLQERIPHLVPLKNPSGDKGWTNAYDPHDRIG